MLSMSFSRNGGPCTAAAFGEVGGSWHGGLELDFGAAFPPSNPWGLARHSATSIAIWRKLEDKRKLEATEAAYSKEVSGAMCPNRHIAEADDCLGTCGGDMMGRAVSLAIQIGRMAARSQRQTKHQHDSSLVSFSNACCNTWCDLLLMSLFRPVRCKSGLNERACARKG